MRYTLRSALLVAALTMFGCGGGGGTSPTTTSSNPSPAGTSTSFTLNIVDGGSTAARTAQIAAPRILATILPSTATHARVIFRNISTVTATVPVLDDNGDPTGQFTTVTQPTELYKRVVDVPYSTSISATVPPSPARGYVVDVLTYSDDGNQHYYMLKYGRSAPNIVIDSTHVSGSVTINPIAPTVTPPANPVNSETSYTVTVNNGTNAMPLRNYYKIRQDLSDVTFASFASYSTHLSGGYFGTRTFTAPTTFATTGSLYMPTQFFIDNSMLGGAKNESYLHWTMIQPVSFGINGLVSVTIN